MPWFLRLLNHVINSVSLKLEKMRTHKWDQSLWAGPYARSPVDTATQVLASGSLTLIFLLILYYQDYLGFDCDIYLVNLCFSHLMGSFEEADGSFWMHWACSFNMYICGWVSMFCIQLNQKRNIFLFNIYGVQFLLSYEELFYICTWHLPYVQLVWLSHYRMTLFNCFFNIELPTVHLSSLQFSLNRMRIESFQTKPVSPVKALR